MSLEARLSDLGTRMLDTASVAGALYELIHVAADAAEDPATPPNVAELLRPVPDLIGQALEVAEEGQPNPAAQEVGERIGTALRLLRGGIVRPSSHLN